MIGGGKNATVNLSEVHALLKSVVKHHFSDHQLECRIPITFKLTKVTEATLQVYFFP